MTATATILLIEGKRAKRRESFSEALSRRYSVLLALTGKQALEILATSNVDVIILNAASMRTSGVRICASLRRRTSVPIILIQEPTTDEADLYNDADITLQLPFTSRKLTNRVERYLNGDEGEVLVAGPFKLNVKSRVLTTRKSEIRLTPKVAALLELFMRSPDEVLERAHLMSKVWNTSYMGDTRTLDVHIRWIREAIERQPSKPRYLRTVRGKGYTLSIKKK